MRIDSDVVRNNKFSCRELIVKKLSNLFKIMFIVMNFTGMRDVRAKSRVLFSLCSKVYIFKLRFVFVWKLQRVCYKWVVCSEYKAYLVLLNNIDNFRV